MSLFGKDFLKEGDQGKSDFDSNYFSQDYGGDGFAAGSSQFGLPPGYGGAGSLAQQQSRLAGLQNSSNNPLFSRTSNAPAGRPVGVAAAPGLGNALGLGGSANSSASNTPGRVGIGADLSRFGGAGTTSTVSQGGLGGLRGLGSGNFSGEDDIMASMGLGDTADDFGSNGSSIFGSAVDSSNSLLGNARAAGGSSLLGGGGLGAISGTGGDLLSSLSGTTASQANSFLSTLSTVGQQPGGNSTSSKDAKFGLLGLLDDVLRASDKDSQQLSLGTDLTTFGLNLSASENLYPTFISPFTENMLDEKPYKVPSCYLAPTASLKAEHITKFSVETLFYMFYLMPKDVFQSLAALELYRREWRYHGELKVWLKQRTQQEMLQAHPQVQFVYFDPKSFEARLFNATGRGNLSAGIVSEEDIRARISPAAIASVTAASANANQPIASNASISSLPGMLGGNSGGLTLGGDSS